VRLERGSSGSIGVEGFRKALLKITNEEIEEMKRKNFVFASQRPDDSLRGREAARRIPCRGEGANGLR